MDLGISGLFCQSHCEKNLVTYVFLIVKLWLTLITNFPQVGVISLIYSMKVQMKPIDFPTGTIRVIFDSVQVVGKCYNIKAESITALISVITSTVYIKLDENSSQNSEILQPKHWLFDKSERIRAVGGS